VDVESFDSKIQFPGSSVVINLCHCPSYRVTALAFCPVCAGGLNKRTSYPHLFLWSSADTNVILSLDACADRGLLRAMCVSSSQTCVLLVSLELAVVEQSRV
jgi:hypothetical protein